MCGILTIVNTGTETGSENLIAACSIIKHRGPDDEGLLTWVPDEEPVIWAGADTAASTHQHWGYEVLRPGVRFKVGFGHRRLSILDLSPAGHQPMRYDPAGLAITFNGEVYNYKEIRKDLEAIGHKFATKTDTEVILHAWAEWGEACLHRFNGMFAFVILDYKKKQLYAVRDRFGVKPICYYQAPGSLYLASEIKQLRTAPGYSLQLDDDVARQYLGSGAVDYSEATFDKQVKYLKPGHYLQMSLDGDAHNFSIKQWYTLQPTEWRGNYSDAADKLREILIDAVDLRLRSDVPVGSCLSGGLDSSSIVCIVADLLKQKGETAGQETVTACYENARFDEWNFAKLVVEKTGSRSHRTFPSFRNLQDEAAHFIWHQDEPTGSTSQFSQWCVFKASHDAGLKVMVDGQGADEQLAGYGGNDISFYSGLMRKWQFAGLMSEALAYKKEKRRWPIGFLLNALKLNTGMQVPMQIADWLRPVQVASLHAVPAPNLQQNLLRQVYNEPLPALLRYEDRNSMAWSVESRTPFMDYRLLEFTLGLPERFVYHNGTRKAILRSAMTNVIPQAISDRRDKMGFVTPEEIWLRTDGRKWFEDGVAKTAAMFDGRLLDAKATTAHVQEMMDGKREFNFMPWRVLCLGVWYEQMGG
jgi:asparagine synthase (glutamine-hydrolysing)